MKLNEIMVSVCIPTYNHEKYIMQAIESVLRQKTNYSYEVLIGEDCSTDQTREILKRFETVKPDFVHIIFREENMNSKKIYNALDLRMRARGKYVITLEGDDFWISDEKIEKEVSFLEENPSIVAVAHNCIVVDEDSKEKNEKYIECHDEHYSIKHFVYGIMPGQFATIMHKNYYKDNIIDTWLMDEHLMIPGDKRMVFSLLSYSNIYCIQESLSAYRHVVKGGSSYSANSMYSFVDEETFAKALIEYSARINRTDLLKAAESLYLLALVVALFKGKISVCYLFRQFFHFNHKLSAIVWLVKRYIYKKKTRVHCGLN